MFGNIAKRAGMSFAVVLGLAATGGAAGVGLVALAAVTHQSCPHPLYRTERDKLKAVAVASEEFALDHGRCPSGTGEMVAEHLLAPHAAHGAYGEGRFALACWRVADDTFVQVRSAGPDGTFDTADDLVFDSERADGP
jgi:hypothetical protein